MIHYITDIGVGNAWVANELREVERAGIPFVLHAIRSPESTYHRSDWATRLNHGTRCIYPLPPVQTLLSLLLAPFLFGSRFFTAAWNALTGERENWRARLGGIAHFLVACHWARTLRGEVVSHVHSQWAHSGATIGMYGTWLYGTSFSFTGHACDLYRDRVALRDKIKRADFIVCISTFHREFFLSNGARPDQLIAVYCGIDPTLFIGTSRKPIAGHRFAIRTACRLVEKKGLPYLIEACRIMKDREVDFECVIGGSGPLEGSVNKLIRDAGLSDRIQVSGEAISQEDLPEFMRSGDVFCLPCVWASDGDVDGLPQTLMEAMACEIPVISTRLVGIPDLVQHEITGLLVEPNNAEQLAEALQRLQEDSDLRRRLAINGRECVAKEFDIRSCLESLLKRYRAKCGIVAHRPEPPLLEFPQHNSTVAKEHS